MSVKLKLTLLLTLLMSLMGGLFLTFMLLISNSVSAQTITQQLTQLLKTNVKQITMDNGRLQVSNHFIFYQDGVSVLIYSQGETLLAGQVPVSFTAQEPFQNGSIRTVETEKGRYLVMDLWRPFDWETGVWVRGVTETPRQNEAIRNLFRVAAAAMPLFILLTALGGWFIVKRSFRPLELVAKTVAAINEARDLTGRIGLPEGRDEFSQLAVTFDGMFERLERSFEVEKQFTADASHELRTPVSIIKGACEYALKYDESPEERQETIAMIHRQSEKMTSIISQLLNMTRLEQGTEQVHMALVDANELVRSVCSEQFPVSVKIHCEADGPLMIKADGELLSRLVRNLIENAVKYGKPDGNVWIRTGRMQGEFFLSVRDDGIGISPEQQKHIWNRFYQVDPARSGDAGAGLGLAIVQQIALIHGGYMSVESELGEGSKFIFHLPDFM